MKKPPFPKVPLQKQTEETSVKTKKKKVELSVIEVDDKDNNSAKSL
jgi:hypothetical protein